MFLSVQRKSWSRPQGTLGPGPLRRNSPILLAFLAPWQFRSEANLDNSVSGTEVAVFQYVNYWRSS